MSGTSTMPASLVRPGTTGILTVILLVAVGMLSFSAVGPRFSEALLSVV